MSAPALSATARRVLGDLARPGWCLRRNSLGDWAVCQGKTETGAGVQGRYVDAWETHGWVASDGPRLYRITMAGRQALEGNPV